MIPITSPQTRPDKIAEAVSRVFHPLIVVIPTMVIAIFQQGNTLGRSLFWTLLAVCVVNVPMAFLILYGVRSGHYSDPSVSVREQRNSIYAVGGFFLVVLLAILVLGKGPLVLTACLISAVLSTAIGYVINRYTKLSLHSAAMAGCTTVLILTAPIIGIVMVLFTPLVGWARIHLKHHTPVQILIGWLLTILPVIVVFRLLLT
jgi:membrane-associated phospholipid phosphatase